MSNYKKFSTNDSILTYNLIKKFFFKNIILFLFISVISVVLAGGIAFFNSQPKLETSVVLKDPPIDLFEFYKPYLSINQKKNPVNNSNPNSNSNSNSNLYFSDEQGLLIERYINNFFTNFRSNDNLSSYIEISKEIQDYKNLIKKKKLDNNSILRSLQIEEAKYRGKILNNKFNFYYPDKFDGKAFLNSYVLYTKDKTLKEYSNTLKSIIINSLSLYEDQLKIAKKINLQQPILKQEYTVIINEPDVLFYRGTKVLEEQIDQHKKILLLLTNVKLDYNPLLDKALFESSSSPTLYIYMLSGFVLGVFFFFFVIYFRDFVLKKSII
jgi:LPS O-antigen subunit length determinant protein (WzzB/FepE family)